MLVKLHYIFSSSCSSKGDSEDYTKRRSGFDICPFFLFALLHALRKNSVQYSYLVVCVCCLYKKTFLDMTWFDLVFSLLQMQRLRRWRFACSWCVVEYSLE